MKRLILATALVVAGCSGGGAAVATEPAATDQAVVAPRATSTPTRATTPQATPEPTPEPLDPAVVFDVFKQIFWTNFEDLYKNDVADAIEDDYVFVESVDRVAYDEAEHTITYTVTSRYESIYARDHDEWYADTWDFMRDYARDFWSAAKEGLGDEISGTTIDWSTFTPALTVAGNKGRLLVSCPGALIDQVGEREADQADFEKECRFKFGRE